MRYQGRITTWKDDKGFGFITPNGGGDRVFLHIHQFTDRRRRPEGDELVTYELTVDVKGRPQAKAVAFVGAPAPVKRRRDGPLPPLFAGGFVGALALAVLVGWLPLAVLGLYGAASAVAFLAYASDKSASRHGRQRIRERTLHLFALAGGWPGALAAQRLLRHKSSKPTFQTVFWVTVALNCGALAWLMMESGALSLDSVLGRF
ncbi:MAG: DUF1294 domain-containing protein [Rhodocyclaceae bacterium]